ncbi:hypothetical protein [Victivallis sp. Marseille-Q1083]|uniref:hypothetical protein n=1 Tax=Victivallis sp. Marseille-Q1083 TaxID=2717288 RepID=UPI00158B398F|nr:hypothetical protein [Victivallis sp. Marseille-Q1083]
MEKEKMKNLPTRESIHAQIVSCAKQRGMTIQGLTERILRAWIDKNFFVDNIANGNNTAANNFVSYQTTTQKGNLR